MKFRKKPVVIEAVQFLGSINELPSLYKFMGDSFGNYDLGITTRLLYLEVLTLEAGEGNYKVTHIANPGDWIVKGIKGEFYTCKPDIFEMTHDYVDEEYESKVQEYCELLNNDKWDTVEFEDVQSCLAAYPRSVYQPELIKGGIDLRVRQWKRSN